MLLAYLNRFWLLPRGSPSLENHPTQLADHCGFCFVAGGGLGLVLCSVVITLPGVA